MKVGLLGCGNIGKEIVKVVNEGKIKLDIISLFDKKKKKAERLAQELQPQPKVSSNMESFLKGVELVVEAASQEAVESYALKILQEGKDLMIMSVGALQDNSLREKLGKICKEKKRKIYIPSGAIVGIDGLKAGKMGKIHSVTLTTRKNPQSLQGMETVKEETLVFEGSGREAVKKFPKNINVAATLSLVGIGFEETKVKIVADPKVKHNIHEIKIKGSFGEISSKSKNVPSPNNPKTSYIAVLSAIANLKKISQRRRGGLKIGT